MVGIHTIVLSVAVLLGVAVRSGEGIKCWVCSSDIDPRCGDPFNMTHLAVTDCDRDRTQSPYLQSIAVCKKTREKIRNELITVRSCSWESDDYGGGPCSSTSTSSYATTEYCSTCTHEACNSADSLSTSALLRGLLPLISAIFVSRQLTKVK